MLCSMSFFIPTQADLNAANADQRVEDNFHHRQVLKRLLEYGETVIAVEQQKAALQSQVLHRPDRTAHGLPDLGARFRELARAMRLTIILADKLAEPLRPTAPAATPSPSQPPHQPAESAQPERGRPERDHPERDHPARDQPERDQPERATAERLDPREQPDRLEGISHATPSEIIAETLQALGLTEAELASQASRLTLLPPAHPYPPRRGSGPGWDAPDRGDNRHPHKDTS
jgi:hypothetical protein